MVRKLIAWALNNPLVVILVSLGLVAFGAYAFLNVNVEAYPDPAPAIIEVIAQFPGATAEEVERQVTIPLEVTLAGMPGLKYTRSKSLFGLSHLRNQFEYGHDYDKARQEVINRLQFTQQLPQGVTPVLSPQSPTGEIYRYTLKCPKDAAGRDIYTLNDLKALQDWVLERDFRRVPRIIDVTSSGGTVKRYEIHPDPDRMKQYGITLQQVQAALTNANANQGGDYLTQGHIAENVRSIGLFGGGLDPVTQVLGIKDPLVTGAAAVGALVAPAPPVTLAVRGAVAAQALEPVEKYKTTDLRDEAEAVRRRRAGAATEVMRAEERERILEIRKLVLLSVNNKDILLEDIVEGGRLNPGDPAGVRGVVVGFQTRLGRVGLNKPLELFRPDGVYQVVEPSGRVRWRNENDKVQCIVLLRKNEDSLPALRDVRKKVEELNKPDSDRMLPGVQIETYYDRTDLINVTTETVRENLFMGVLLVVSILFMFVSNVRTAIIVAINIPLALLFAFAVLYLRGKSANLLSIGAVDFGIIVDSSVIMVENIYRHLSGGEHAELPLKERILLATREIDRALLFSTAIMVCAFIPLFTMRGPEGQLFGPMADTYAFALAGALLLALTLAPVLCMYFFKNLKPQPDNFLMRFLRDRYLRQLERCLKYRGVTVLLMAALIAATGSLLFLKKQEGPPLTGWDHLSPRKLAQRYTFFGDGTPVLGREFMPELEEGNLWIRGTFPLNISLDRVAANAEQARAILGSEKYPEVETVVLQIGRPDDGTDPTGFYNVEIFVPLRPQKEWPGRIGQGGWRKLVYGPKRPRSKKELEDEMKEELKAKLPGVDWNFSQNIRDNVMESLSGIKGDNSVKIFGPDLDELERLAAEVKKRLEAKNPDGTPAIDGIQDVGVFNIKGQTNLEFRIDLDKCKRWGVSAADVNNVVQTALGGKAMTTMIEGEKIFDVAVRWPAWRRDSRTSILDIPVDVTNNQVVLSTGPGVVPRAVGTGVAPATPAGTLADTSNPISSTPRLRLRDLVSPVGRNGRPDPNGRFERAAASTIYREQGKRLIAVKFSVDLKKQGLASAVAKAQEQCEGLVQAPYRIVWSGEFEQMEAAEGRLLLVIPLSLGLIFVLLYMAFRSLIDALAVFSNVLALAVGGIWALVLTQTHFSISAAVGFVSLFGVAIMDGLLLISYFNALRAQGLPLHDAIMQGAAKRVRPVMITALTAILGLLPAALSTRIGAQTQRPLAIVVVGGMLTTLFLTRYLMPVLYSFYGHREPPEGSGDLAH
jgi:cobalt-zinc-cadmium resistance protein CzcA